MAISRSGKIIGWLFTRAMAILNATVRISFYGLERMDESKIVGYWHGDTCASMLILHEIKKAGVPVSAVVTADWRGDTIEKIISRDGATALRMRSGYAVRENIRSFYDAANSGGRMLVAALDGPSGPRHKPKRLLFRAAQQSGREMLALKYEYGAVIKLLHRWDKYAIPLPFSRLRVHVIDLGKVTREDLTDFESTKEKLVV